MSEAEVISITKEPVTKSRIIHDLRTVGIKPTDTLLVHSSLSKMGFAVGKEITVVNALLETVNKGNLVMPSQSGDNSDPDLWMHPPVPKEWVELIREETPSYDPNTFSTRGMGRVVECFRHFPKVRRSPHPMDSFIARGPKSRWIVKMHDLTPAFGEISPLARLYDLNAKVLFIGTGYDTCTAFHLAEQRSGTLKTQRQGTKMNGQWVFFEDFNYDTEDFIACGKALEDAQLTKHFKVGQADCIIFEMKSGIDFATEWFKTHRT